MVFWGSIQSETVMLLRTKITRLLARDRIKKGNDSSDVHACTVHRAAALTSAAHYRDSAPFNSFFTLPPTSFSPFIPIHLYIHTFTMNFEDIVDMDWLNSNTTSDNTLSPASIQDDQMASFPTANYCTDNALYAFSDPSLFWPNDLSSASTDLGFKFDLQQQQQQQSGPISAVPSDKQTTVQQPESKLPELVMPSTEHIKQLIEIAKQHLALREQQQKLQVQGEPTSFTPGALPIPALFATGPTTPSTTVMPNTVSPESLMKGVTGDMDESIHNGNNNNNNMGDNKKSSSSSSTSSSSSISGTPRASSVIPEETMTLEAYAESDGIDIKKLTPKERRQLRNKISARNFRVRRKGELCAWLNNKDDHSHLLI